jgi:D-alanyl-D-alanine dipeptidase
VLTADWRAIPGTLQRYERASSMAKWQPVGGPINIVVGRSGLAWGIGLNAPPAAAVAAVDPLKIEGDGKAPAGVFALGGAFGYAPLAQVAAIHMSYLQTQDSDLCVDDPDSRYYNTLVSTTGVHRDWKSAEMLRRNDDLYRLGIVVEHNWGDAKKRGKGSCIFLHIWSGADQGTDGCTAMSEPAIRELIAWLDPKLRPVLVQLPANQYSRLKASWRLP